MERAKPQYDQAKARLLLLKSQAATQDRTLDTQRKVILKDAKGCWRNRLDSWIVAGMATTAGVGRLVMTLEERLLAYMDEHDWTRLDGVQRHHVRAWPDGTYLCVQALLDFWVLIEGTLDEDVYYDQWEYHTEEEALAALASAPEGEDLGDWAPGGWYNRRPASDRPRVPLPPSLPRPLKRLRNRPAWRH